MSRGTLLTRRGSLAWLVLVGGLLLALLLHDGLRERSERSARQQFELHVREVVEAIEQRLRDHEQVLLGGAGLFDAGGAVSRDQWHTYVERLRLGERYPGILGVGFSVAIPPAELAAHVAAVRAEGFPGYAVKPPGERELYTAIVYLEPFAGRNLAAFGYDMFSEETRRQAMRMAVESGETAISGKVRLVQETHGKVQAGFLMYVPVYRTGLPVATAAERWQALRGYVYSPYRVDDLMKGILGSRDLPVDFTLHDGSEATADALMYSSAEERPLPEGFRPRYTRQRQIHAYGRDWTVLLHSRPAFEAQFDFGFRWLVLALGIGISLSLFAFTWSLLGRRERALALAQEMTERSREADERFRQLFLHLGQGVVIHDREGRIVDANGAAERLLGLSLDRMRELPAAAGWHAVDEAGGELPAAAQPVAVALRRGEAVTGRVLGLALPNAGGWRWVRGDAYPEHAGEGDGVARLFAVYTDITEQRAADLEVRQARRLLAEVLAAASEFAIIATDGNGMITLFNRGAERMLGYSAGELEGHHLPLLFHLPAELEERGRELSTELGRPVTGFRALVEEAERHGSEQREWTYRRKDGSSLPVSLVVTAMHDEAGGVIGYLGIAEEISGRLAAAEALREQARHTQAILDNVLEGIITIDERGIVATVNPAAERIFGYPAGEVIGRNVNMLMPEPHRSAHDRYLADYCLTGEARVIGIGREVEGRRSDGSGFPMELAVSEIVRGGERLFIGMVRDITERKRVERMQNEFVSTVSHELRTPLTSISGALGLLAGGALGPLSEQAGPVVEIALRNSQRLTILIDDLLDMEKIAAGKLQFELHNQPLLPLVEQALEAVRAYGERYGVRFRLELREEGTVRVDGQRLIQILSNFLSNAAKFSPAGEEVTVAVRCAAGRARVEVRDRGPGVSAEFRPRIFQKFSQADSSDTRKKGGTGLGLAISRELAERMGGEVGFASEEGAGATFFVELPLAELPADGVTQG